MSNLQRLDIGIKLSQDAHYRKEGTVDAERYSESQHEILNTLKVINASKKLKEIIDAEKLLLTTEAVKSQQQESSIKAALTEYGVGMNALSVVEDKEGYKKAHLTYPDKEKDSLGLPKDAFRKFIDGHLTRLRNKLSNPESQLQVELLKQRQANLKQANALYIEKQKEALAPDPRKEKADALRTLDQKELLKKHPDLVRESAVIRAAMWGIKDQTPEMTQLTAQAIKAKVADMYERGEKLPEVEIADQE